MFSLDFTSRQPIYEQIYESVIRYAAIGVLNIDDKLQTVRALAAELGINPNTVAKAYQMLERDGIIYTVAGRGSFVAAANGRVDSTLTKDFEEKARDALKAGISKETLVEIINKLTTE